MPMKQYLYANSTYEVRYCKKKDLKRNVDDLIRIASNIKTPLMILKDNSEFDTKLFGKENIIRVIGIKKRESGEYEVYLNNVFRKEKIMGKRFLLRGLERLHNGNNCAKLTVYKTKIK